MKTTYLVTVEHPKPLPEGFADMAAGRIESMSFIDLVTAEPISETEVSGDYWELLFAVGNKYAGETRHETALRYIQNAERGTGEKSGSKA